MYLNLDEIKQIELLDLSHIQYLDRVRDMFLIGCFTGLRFSDFTQLKKSNLVKVNGREIIKIRTTKTNEDVVIPVSPLVSKIFKKYDGELPRMISNQKMNDYVKELCKLAEISEMAEIKRTNGSKIISQNCPKWQLVSTHTARRSFATNAYKATKSSINIMKITGHRTESAFLKYIKISKEENATLLSEHEFFN